MSRLSPPALLLALALTATACQEPTSGIPTCDDAGRAAIALIHAPHDAAATYAARRVAALCRDDRWPPTTIACIASLTAADRLKCKGLLTGAARDHLAAALQDLGPRLDDGTLLDDGTPAAP